MNMKKTMAAIAAGAVAVSAMATSVSALADKTLKYNLVATTVSKGDGEVTLTARFTNLDLSTYDDGDQITLKLNSGKTGEVKSVSITGRNTVDNAALTPINLSTDDKSDNYSTKLTKTGDATLTLGPGRDLPIGTTAAGDPVTVTLVVSYVVKHKASQADINTSAKSVDIQFGGASVVNQEATASNYSGQSDDKTEKPFKTTLGLASQNVNIIKYLETADVNPNNPQSNGSYGSYVNVGAVLNDAVANYEGVVFKFNTATKRVIDAAAVASILADGDTSNDWLQWSIDQYAADWMSKDWSNDYSMFAEHLYTGTNGLFFGTDSYYSEVTGYTGYDWSGYNLFQGALVVNESLTMSLSDTEFFDWQGNSISFDWDSIYSNAMTSNNFATYIQSLKLATSSTWYWDSMEVELTAGAAEDASSGAGATGDDDTLDDGDDDGDDISLDDDGDDDDDIDVGGDDDDDDDGDDIDTDTNDTQAPAQTASNPQTGNASVALAVIPVALAAAAIVAKKRG